MSLFWSINGCSQQTIEVLQKCGLSLSVKSISSLQNNLARIKIAESARIARGPHKMGYDNLNVSTSIFVEQRSWGPAKVQSGTFAILYELRNVSEGAMQLAPILERARIASDLSFNADIRPSLDQQHCFHRQLLVHLVGILAEYAPGFSEYLALPELQHKIRRQMPADYVTKQYPLRVSTIDESSIAGQTKVLHNVYIDQMKMKHEDFEDRPIPSFHDQHTNARTRGAQAMRLDDVNNFTKLKMIQLGFGVFHFCLNLIWALLHVHRGSITQLGSLTYFFTLMDKARLGGHHPDYHTLLAALKQILHGIILNAWRKECGHTTLTAFAISKPSAAELLVLAEDILVKHATRMPDVDLEDDDTSSESSSIGGADPEGEIEADEDIAHCNLKILTHDLLYVIEVVSAASCGDWGRIEDILGSLAMMFRGAGSNNYCAEVLHFIHNLKKVWTPEFA
jgi:hypothetical protein